ECHARFGATFTVRTITHGPVVMVSTAEDIRRVLAAPGDLALGGSANFVLKPLLGRHSLLLLDGGEHQRMRKLQAPPFHGDRALGVGEAVLALADDAIDRTPVGEPFSALALLQDLALRVIMRSVLGLAEGDPHWGLRDRFLEVMEAFGWPPMRLTFLHVDLGPKSPWGRFVRAYDAVDAGVAEVVARRRAEGGGARADVLSMLLDARDERGEGLGRDEVRDALLTLVVAGHDTSASALAWGLHGLLDEPGVWHRLRAEVAECAADGRLEARAVERLPFLDAVVREALRWTPVIISIGRRLAAPLELGGRLVPAGVIVSPSIYLAHRNPAVYAAPGLFRPQRFLTSKPGPYEFLPFGAGARRCLGAAFATQTMKMVLAALALRTEPKRAPGAPPVRPVRRSVTVTPSGGLPIVFARKAPRGQALGAA
ncbi:MAG TPA: cytochrome P450, partial [Polyangiaceae bacterium]|nr:cytochrome P450 [Polyangiaceae bacterium]